MTIAIAIAVVYFVVGVFALALCKSAAKGDEMMERAIAKLYDQERDDA